MTFRAAVKLFSAPDSRLLEVRQSRGIDIFILLTWFPTLPFTHIQIDVQQSIPSLYISSPVSRDGSTSKDA